MQRLTEIPIISHKFWGERQTFAQKGVRAIVGEKPQLEMVNAPQKPGRSVRTPFVWYFGAGWFYALWNIWGDAPEQFKSRYV